jgi:hypothetical protein
MGSKQSFLSLKGFKTCIWLLSISFWVFGIVERDAAILACKHFSLRELGQVLMMALFLGSWFILKPEYPKLKNEASDS